MLLHCIKIKPFYSNYESLKVIDIKKLNQLIKSKNCTPEEEKNVREAHRKLKNREYAKLSREKDEVYTIYC